MRSPLKGLPQREKAFGIWVKPQIQVRGENINHCYCSLGYALETECWSFPRDVNLGSHQHTLHASLDLRGHPKFQPTTGRSSPGKSKSNSQLGLSTGKCQTGAKQMGACSSLPLFSCKRNPGRVGDKTCTLKQPLLLSSLPVKRSYQWFISAGSGGQMSSVDELTIVAAHPCDFPGIWEQLDLSIREMQHTVS